ncbi:hypothetical protein BT67DRAFT_439164 [Trichocladium antarcticum]|uniref:Glycerophosphocholine acyltransferase 1 n=1 Tax=Trichocladium antarcticum TaxID=1450529 RepID=A0AAN6ZGV6_9PEZI|nr:hypothetical protein BT67DRAFT_439164 [Trichocladium antarcticum]
MAEPEHGSGSKWESTDSETALTPELDETPPDDSSQHNDALDTPTLGPSLAMSPRHSPNPSVSGSSSYHEDWDPLPSMDRLSMLDMLDNFVLSQHFEKFQRGIAAQTKKVRKSREALESKSRMARERMVDEWRRRAPSAEEQLDRYRTRMRTSVEKLGRRWNDTKSITLREKISFICGVMNIFVSGYLIGGWPEWFHIWYTVQLLYFMPLRYYSYHKRGYHYFLADLCYFVNLLLLLSIWAFPGSKRLLTATYSLAYGNNAVAIIMWRNSLVFHSFDKVTSLFIHIMPCATLHCIVHLLDPATQAARFPAIHAIRTSPPGGPTAAYTGVLPMLAWSTLPYAVWQLTYYVFITVRRRDKIAAGRPTSFTWLRKSYSKAWIGRVVLSLPPVLQEPAFMLIQYAYAVLTMLPCPLWFLSRHASAAFLMGVFLWSVYNGGTYYIDVFGNRFQKELEAMRAEVAKWQNSPDLVAGRGMGSPALGSEAGGSGSGSGNGNGNGNGNGDGLGGATSGKGRKDRDEGAGGGVGGVDAIPLLNDERPSTAVASGADVDGGARDVAAAAAGARGRRLQGAEAS